MQQYQDITFFDIEDDEVPLAGYGSVDEYGNIIESTFSTDPEHPRPYLKLIRDFGESIVDFQQGGAVLGTLVAEIIDARLTANDQDTGVFTYIAATAAGNTALLGVRVLVREQDSLGVYQTKFDGVCGQIAMPKTTTFSVALKDIRERENKLKLFNQPTGTCIWPRVGPKNGWGYGSKYSESEDGGYVQLPDPVMPRITGIAGTYRSEAIIDGGLIFGIAGAIVVNPTGQLSGTDITSEEYKQLLDKYGTWSISTPSEMLGFTASAIFGNVRVEWAPVVPNTTPAEEDFKSVGPMMLGGIYVPNSVFIIRRKRINGADGYYVYAILLNCTDEEIYDGKQPSEGQQVWVRVVSALEPSEEVPLFLEEPLGVTLKKAYDGTYSRDNTVIPVRYNQARMEDMIWRSPMGRGRITASVDDGRAWLQENVWRLMGAAPAIREGLVYPIYSEVPDEDVPLVQLDDTNTISATWSHGPDNVINQVIVEFEREVVPATLPQFAKPKTYKVVIERDRLEENSQRRHGTKPLIFKPVTLRSLVSEADAFSRIPTEDAASLVAEKRGEEELRRFTNGAQVVEAVCAKDDTTKLLNEGDWIIGAWSWLPDYITRQRGMSRLMQILKIRRNEPHKLGFLLVDAGPHDVPMTEPSIDAMVEGTNGVVTVSVSGVPADGRAEVQFAFGDTMPESNSGQWHTLGFLDADGDILTQRNLRPGETLWTRTRGTADGRRASAWTLPESLTLDDAALIRNFYLAIEKDSNSAHYGKPKLIWEALTGTLGVRAQYKLHAKGSDMPTVLDEYQDFDATLGEGHIDLVLRQWEQITVQIVGYSGFVEVSDIGIVDGVAGSASSYRTVDRVEEHYVEPVVGERPSRSGFTGTLMLEIQDSQLQITLIRMRSKVGDAAYSEWTEFAADEMPTLDATILPGLTTRIGYEMYAYDHAGTEQLIQSGEVQYTYEGPLGLIMEITEVSGADPDNEQYFEIRVADPVPQGDDTILVTADPNTRVLDPVDLGTTGASTGTPTADIGTTGVLTATFQRPEVFSDDEVVALTAVATGRTDAVGSITLIAKTAVPAVVTFVSIGQSGNDLTGNFTITGDYSYFIITVTPDSPLGDVVGAHGQTVFDMNFEKGWNLNPSGMGNHSANMTCVAYDADDNPLDSDSGGGGPWAADPDT